MSHPAEESLIAYAAGAVDDVSVHIESCRECRTEAAVYKELFENPRSRRAAPKPPTAILGVAARLEAEESAAAEVLAGLQSRPPAEWGRFITETQPQTVGMVRALSLAAENRTASDPPGALAIARAAKDVAEALSGYPDGLLLRTRAHAWRELSYQLYYVGDFPPALSAAERGEELLDGIAGAEYDLARVRLMKAMLLRALDRSDEAFPLANESVAVLQAHGDVERHLAALSILAAMHYRCGNIQAALGIFTTIREHPLTQTSQRMRTIALFNVAVCLKNLDQLPLAQQLHNEAVDSFVALGMKTEEMRVRWSLAQILTRQQEFAQALANLRPLRTEFDALQMRDEVRYLTVEIVELLLLLDEHQEACGEAAALMSEFASSGLASTRRARKALALLREAADQNSVTSDLIREVREHLHEISGRPPAFQNLLA